MSPEKNSRPSDVSGRPTETHPDNVLVRKIADAVTELQTARGYIEKHLDEARSDVKDMIARLARLEVKVDALPSKVWIGTVVLGGMAIITGICTVIALALRSTGK